MPAADLPARGDRAAPEFNSARPRELSRYFEDLEFLFGKYSVTDETDKRKAAVRYLDIDTGELWKTCDAYDTAQSTYEDFKKEVYTLYPGSTDDRLYSLGDLERLVSEYQRNGLLTSADLGQYHRQFVLISKYLIKKKRLSDLEQSRTFMRGFQPALAVRIEQRLQLKNPDHMPDDPYKLADIHAAANFILLGSNTGLAAPPTFVAAQPPPPTPAAPAALRIEDLAALVVTLTEKVQAMTTQPSGSKTKTAVPRYGNAQDGGCRFCNGEGHFIRDCEVAAEYGRTGKCKRNSDGRIVLPSGAAVPRDLESKCIRDSVDAYHRRNPGQLAASAMLLEVRGGESATSAPASSSNPLALVAMQASRRVTESAGWSTESDRIGTREREALALRTQARPEVVINTRPPAAGKTAAPPPPQELAAQPQAAGSGPSHPYAAARDATNATLPQARYNAEPTRQNAQRRPEGGNYSNTAKIYDEQIATDVYNRAMNAPITLTQRELLSLSPEVRAQVADATIAGAWPENSRHQTPARARCSKRSSTRATH
ncbi:hypothetical protein BC834DRAFT_835888 [Gloeopeniophorella convolvens]|nr:hypothetical protein BC834DRAFT_835888 [Gloeopeniophorella convolvens]